MPDDSLHAPIEPNAITSIERRLVDAAADIAGPDVDSPQYLHALLCQVGFPRSNPKSRTFERISGKAALRLEAGNQWLGKDRGFRELPLPYGSRPRLVLYHLCSEAIRNREKVVDIGNSLADFIETLGIDSGGRDYTRFKSQMVALCGVRMTLGYDDGLRSITVNTAPVHRFEAWTHYDGRQLGFWPGYLELSSEFYETLRDHAVPLDPRAIHALQHSALALDVYAWLAHRLRRVKKPGYVRISWRSLKEQFGQEYKESKDFKKEFRDCLRKVRLVYPDARIGEMIGGLILYASPPPIPETKVVVSLPYLSE